MKKILYKNGAPLLRASLIHFALVFLSMLFFTAAKGQTAPKKILTAKDYPLWHNLEAEDISDNGAWISYKKTYSTADTLFVQHRKTGRKYFVAGGVQGIFASETHYLCRTPDNTLHMLSLADGKEQLFKNVTAFETAGDAVIASVQQKQSASLSVYSLKGRLLFSADSVADYALSRNKKRIAVALQENRQKTVYILNLSSPADKQLVARESAGPFQQLTWSEDSSVLAFMHFGTAQSNLYYYQLAAKAMSILSTAQNAMFPETMNMEPKRKLAISPDNKRVFFRMRQRKELDNVHPKNEVQIWNAADKYIYPAAIAIQGWNILNKHALWEPATGRFFQFTDPMLPSGGEAKSMNYALTFNLQDYEPQSNLHGDRDVYITDLDTGERKLLLKKHITNTTNLLASPGGKYVSYFKDGSWYVYDVQKETHVKVSQNIPYPLDIPGDMFQGESYGNPGWVSGEKDLLLYDQYDIWKVSADGLKAQRLTEGREKGIVYRIVPQNELQRTNHDIWIHTGGLFDLKVPLVLTARSVDHLYNGIFIWDQKKGLSKICYTDKGITTIMRSKNNVFAWTQEDADLPWQVMAKESGAPEALVVQSNPQQQNYMWTRNETVAYQNSKGENLTGVLYYPAAFEKGKLYPMIVHVYEKQSNQLHYYNLPDLRNSEGFNIANLTAKGYFVLLPDIVYETGNVGMSAVDCVEAAVKAVLNKNEVDVKKIGLIGHSFGGFETDFIITQSRLFACAVAGSATTNNLSAYLAVSPSYKIPNFGKMEFGQARMKVSPYENMDWYLKNSPVIHAAKVATPLLSWTGLQDPQVLPSQSFEFYMALRRLGKKHIMLAYPEEGHDLTQKENAIDLTWRIEAWFDYYLKDEKAPSWFN